MSSFKYCVCVDNTMHLKNCRCMVVMQQQGQFIPECFDKFKFQVHVNYTGPSEGSLESERQNVGHQARQNGRSQSEKRETDIIRYLNILGPVSLAPMSLFLDQKVESALKVLFSSGLGLILVWETGEYCVYHKSSGNRINIYCRLTIYFKVNGDLAGKVYITLRFGEFCSLQSAKFTLASFLHTVSPTLTVMVCFTRAGG